MINWEYFRELEMKVGRQDALEDGRAQGMQQGMQRGERVEKVSTARRMKAKDCDVAFIAEITGLAREQIEKL